MGCVQLNWTMPLTLQRSQKEAEANHESGSGDRV